MIVDDTKRLTLAGWERGRKEEREVIANSASVRYQATQATGPSAPQY